MSQAIAKLVAEADIPNITRAEMLELAPELDYGDGRTKQSFQDETNIEKIMARADIAGTISHLAKYEGVYADYSDFDFHEQTERLTQGRMIFDDLPAEVRKEFGQSPMAFFEYVNDPINAAKPDYGLPHLAKPGKQMASATPADADTEAAAAAGSEPVASETKKAPADKQAETPPPAS